MLTLDQMEKRKGLVSASQMHRIMQKTKRTEGCKTYVTELVLDELYEDMSFKPTVFSTPMNWGNDNESKAILEICKRNNIDESLFFDSETGEFLKQYDPFISFESKFICATPDLVIISKDHNILRSFEVKCPYNSINHLNVFNEGLKAIDKKYIYQVQTQMYCMDLNKITFVSFDPRLKEQYQYIQVDIERDDSIIALIVERSTDAINLKNEILSKIKEVVIDNENIISK